MKQQSDDSSMALVSIDLCGYGLLMDRDEAGTHQAMMTCLRTILEPTMADRHGRIVKSTGDGALIVFPGAVDAVRGMIDFLDRIAAWNDPRPKQKHLRFRVGIHAGTAIVDAGDLYGQGVNLAVRLQEIAEPRSIFISKAVFDQLDDQSRALFAYRGNGRLKNIQKRVAVYRWREGGTRHSLPNYRQLAAAMVALMVVLSPWNAADNEQANAHGQLERGRWPTNDRSKIAVLPFAYRETASGFRDLVGELPSVIRSDLARNPNLFVLNPNQDRQVDQQNGYVLKGAIEEHENGVRVSIHLKDPEARSSRWTEDFDEASLQSKALGDHIARRVASSVALSMRQSERIVQNRCENAYNAYLSAVAHYDRHTPLDLVQAVSDLEEALIWDPNYSRAHALLAAVYWTSWQNRWRLRPSERAETTLVSAELHLAKALEPTAIAQAILAEMLTKGGRYADAIAAAERAIVLEPDEPFGYYAKGLAMIFEGRPDAALPFIRTAIQLNPHGQRYLCGLALAEYGMERFNSALKTLKRATSRNPDDDWSFLLLAATYGQLRWADGAREAIARFDALSLERRNWSSHHLPYVLSWPFRYERDRRRLHDGIEQAGIKPQFRVAVRR
ncbi:MAG: adenylate/guanylate cyclase domain-containing protein [Geminicoccaceae bacterium]